MSVGVNFKITINVQNMYSETTKYFICIQIPATIVRKVLNFNLNA